jgi:hypothetical protein
VRVAFPSLFPSPIFINQERKKKMAQKKKETRKAKPAMGKAPFPIRTRPQSDTDISEVEMPAGTGLTDKKQFGM